MCVSLELTDLILHTLLKAINNLLDSLVVSNYKFPGELCIYLQLIWLVTALPTRFSGFSDEP